MSDQRHGLGDVRHVAGELLAQAQTVGSRHLAFGSARVQFNQAIARFAKGIVDDVANGRLSADMGLDALAQEQRHLLNQSRSLVRNIKGAIPEAVKKRPLSMLRQHPSRSDPDRLLRAIHQQNLRVTRLDTSNNAGPHPVDDLKFFPSEHWPQERPAPPEPGFYVVPKSIVAEKLEAQLFPSAKPNVIARFRSLNPNADMIKAGSMIVLSDPDNQQCTYEEALLMQTARFVSATLEPLTVEEADFMAQHYGVIQTALAYESKVIGVVTAMAANHLDGIKNVLADLEKLHVHTLDVKGSLNSKPFKKQRAQLLEKLDVHLNQFTRQSIGLPDHPSLKTALGIDHPHLVHRWRKAGGIGQNPGYATHIRAISQASQYVKYGGWIGTAVGGGASALKVQDVCLHGNTEACEKVKFTETGSFMGGMAGGAISSRLLTAPLAAKICLGIGVPTGGVGTLVCGAVAVGVGSLAAVIIGETLGEDAAEIIYQDTR
ncbi:hypothetical protein ABIA54_002768 [Pseudomonas sp. EB276 TE3739]|uniref:hypothetical protein n=1 Tax=Pseudomonas TaxID=286 RepID=UPI0020A0A5A0|nr:hypothetical protein [Pseudomonas koreensis]MCP1473148.1 hypothetical protein [Pseudomonas koreensis]